MNYIVVDLSKYSTGILTSIDGKKNVETLTIKKGTSQEKCLKIIFDWFFNKTSSHYFDIAFIENYAIGSGNNRGKYELAEIGGVVKYYFAHCQIPIIPVNISTWKSFYGKILTGKEKIDKRKDKERYFKFTLDRTGIICENIDEADACLIGHAVWDSYRSIEDQNERALIGMTPGMLEVCKKIKKIKLMLKKK